MTKPLPNFDPINTELLTGINLIEASAGTGKTYTIAMLVLRFVVEQDLGIKQILVVTFTKAATEELKDRIRKRLAETRLYAQGNNDQLESNVKQWLDSLSIVQDLIIQRLNNALMDIDQAGIFTIHGFCQRILAEHALESGQLFDSELTGDISSIKQACSDDFWRQQVYPRSAWEASLLTAQYKTPDQLLASVDFIAPELTVVPDYEDLELALIKLKQCISNCKINISSSLQTIEEKLQEGKFKDSFQTDFKNTNYCLSDWLDEKSITTPDFSLFTQQGLLDGLNGQKFRKSKANPMPSDEQKQLYIEELGFNSQSFEQLDHAIRNISLMFRRSLLQTLHKDVSKKLQQLNILSFDDLISRLAEALKSEKGQALRLEIQQHYQAALIDEFQDNDQNQWLIFSSLFHSSEHALYLIGDPKQAIYKFRGADIQTYFSAKQLANHEFNLGFNWRSHPLLVEGVNRLFNTDKPFLSDKLTFTPVAAGLTAEQGLLINEQSLPPIVLWQLDKNDKAFWTAGKATAEIKTAVVNEILELLIADFTVQEKAIQAKDIAILVRTNPQAKEFQQALNAAGVTAVINSKESVFASTEAFDLYTVLQAVAEPTNNALLKQTLTLNWFNLNGQQLFQALNNELTMDDWLSRFLDYQNIWQNKGLMAMMQRLLANENVYPHLSRYPQAERCITNLQHSIELVQQAAIDEHLGINKTLDWLHNNITQATSGNASSDEQQLRLESDDDAVKIITMHSSKGLEYPIVFCPFLWQRGTRLNKEQSVIKCYSNDEMIADIGSEQFEQHRQNALAEELQEDLRVFYVAVTRAKYRCYINWADVRTKDKANESAIAYLLNFSGNDFLQQQQKLQHFSKQQADVFEYRLLETEQTIHNSWQAQHSSDQLNYKKRQRSLYSYWQMSSYSALSYLSTHDAPELPDDKAREDNSLPVIKVDKEELPRGAHTGNVIHDLLENIPFYILAKDNDITEQRDKACLRYGLKTDYPEQIDDLLRQTVNTNLSTATDCFSLKQLKDQQCLKEMPFYLSMKTMDVSQINHILQDCPTYQPLSEKIMCGYLTGFIDLICEHNGQYYVMDYKSNGLESYEQDDLIKSMREHNYGLQYWIYTLVLHQYLKTRLPNYSYQQHFGGVMYLFVRGMDEKLENSGVYQTKPELEKIDQLADLFIST
ncbi:MAG: exodeoxyribonuclease V subunit beta [Methylomarinum sp.]|nr:exodeoxyribonuclease V subunit beta [Methylomarinum sp.]